MLESSLLTSPGCDGAPFVPLCENLESARASAPRCSQKFRDVQIETRQGVEMERR
jgi:hypothetical protein